MEDHLSSAEASGTHPYLPKYENKDHPHKLLNVSVMKAQSRIDFTVCFAGLLSLLERNKHKQKCWLAEEGALMVAAPLAGGGRSSS